MVSSPKNLITGIPRIDKEHRSLLEMIEWVEGICTIANATNCRGCILSVRDRCSHSLNDMTASLDAYMREHFRYEESLMGQVAPKDHVIEHQAAHRSIETRLSQLISGFAREGNSTMASRQVANELRAWLDDHLETLDAVLAIHVGPEDNW